MQCAACGNVWFRPEADPAECPSCGRPGEAVAALDDRRAVIEPVPEDRRTNVPEPPPDNEDLRTGLDRREVDAQSEIDRAERRNSTPRRA